MPSDERALATWLAALDDVALAATFAARGVGLRSGWNDFFDAAEALLDTATLEKLIVTLDRDTLTLLAGDATPSPQAQDRAQLLALLSENHTPFGAVAAVVKTLQAQHPDAFVAAAPPSAPAVADSAQSAAAAERAFAASGSLADIVLACLHGPFTRTGTGTVSAADRKRLIDDGAVDEADELEDALLVASTAGLVRAGDRVWTVTDAGEAWLEASTLSRWSQIVAGIRDALPADLRTPDGGVVDIRMWATLRPLDLDWPAQVTRFQRIAERWGIIDATGAEPVWTTPLREGGDIDTAPLGALLATEIDRVYLQADLTAIAPGPLQPALDLRLRSVAHRESRAQASTYRFTAESLTAGMTDGETAASIRAFLGELSLTGIPQPLEYLIDSTAQRHGLVQVRTDAATGRTAVSSTERSVLQTISVDQALRSLGLVPDGDALMSRVGRDAVYWTLADARYPVVAVDDDGNAEPVRRRSVEVPTGPIPDATELYAPLVKTLRTGHGTDGEAGWLERELEQAVRARGEIVVTVRMPDGSERSFTLEATGLGGGRLRGRDRAADIERTLPVSSIVSVVPADA
ncbi:helicase-associated domain-containing protein [Microbacterium sp. C7(2022)]|uniref:helicase-associated domain-containing protein n=1 Tax=Microbacterium sp. C7(2022) TaxID=2992759 RepID=UPI00237ACE03|nr:helicase-associated domain-containing protein [Microbacterium sp. C7(2022)]MDE0547110.1 helicase-associated domain-containing protein [Microbacterium sp. C7(2022)]